MLVCWKADVRQGLSVISGVPYMLLIAMTRIYLLVKNLRSRFFRTSRIL